MLSISKDKEINLENSIHENVLQYSSGRRMLLQYV